MASFSTMIFNEEDFGFSFEPIISKIVEAVYAMEEKEFRSVIVDRMRELGYIVLSPDKFNDVLEYLDGEDERSESPLLPGEFHRGVQSGEKRLLEEFRGIWKNLR